MLSHGESFRFFMENSSIHGLRTIIQSKSKVERSVFILTFIACISFLIYGCYQIVDQFIKLPVATSYFIQEAKELPLPDVTICPFNRLDRDFLDKNNISSDLRKYIEWSFFIVSPRYEYVNFTVGRDAASMDRREEQLTELLTRRNSSWAQFLEDASLRCSDVIHRCMHEYMPRNCCRRATNIMTSLGRCVRLNGAIQVGSGFGMGQTIMIQLPVRKYSMSENMLLNDGVMVKLTEPGKGYEFDALFIPPGVHALLQLRATKMDFMDIASYRCRSDVSDDYAPLLCYQECLLEPVGNVCKCRYVGSSLTNFTRNLPVCRPKQVLACGYNAIADKLRSDRKFPQACRDRCRPRCTYWHYQATVSYSKYPSSAAVKRYFQVTNKTTKTTRLIRNPYETDLIMEVYFDKLEYTTIKHFPSVTLDQFLADIGGQMSLWVGASILSLIHLAVFFTFGSATDSNCRKKSNAQPTRSQIRECSLSQSASSRRMHTGPTNDAEKSSCCGSKSKSSMAARYVCPDCKQLEPPVRCRCESCCYVPNGIPAAALTSRSTRIDSVDNIDDLEVTTFL